MSDNIGIVVIGRNEGTRLKDSLQSVKKLALPAVYADSASTDDSVATARGLGIPVAALPPDQPLNAAKGRNAGQRKLLEIAPSISYIQFIDGDTVIDADWVKKAVDYLDANPSVGIVCGVLNEKECDSSHWKILSAIEWRNPTGEIQACGGNLMARKAFVEGIGGWDETLPAGEEIVFCSQARQAGWKIVRLDVPMGEHESRVQTWQDYMRRCVRTGYGYAQVTSLYGTDQEPFYRRELRSALLFGAVIPLMIVVLMLFYGAWPLLFLAVYPLQALRIYMKSPATWSPREAALYAGSCVLAKFPECFGALNYFCKGQ